MRTPSTEVDRRILTAKGNFSVRSMHRDLLESGCQVSWSRVADAIDRLRVSGRIQRFLGPDNGPSYRVVEDVPYTVGSVVWYDGHPFVLDGEPGIPGERRWVGIGREGLPITVTHEAMCQYGPAVIYRDAGDLA